MQGTYEETLINTANQKSGLNEAILGNINAGGNPEDNAKRIARLLREGANSIADESVAAEKAEQFAGQDIEDILSKRTSKRNVANKAGNTFSVASFRAEGQPQTDDASFWQDLLPEAVKAHQAAEKSKNLMSGPRVRKRINYREPGAAPAVDDVRSSFAALAEVVPAAHFPLPRLRLTSTATCRTSRHQTSRTVTPTSIAPLPSVRRQKRRRASLRRP